MCERLCDLSHMATNLAIDPICSNGPSSSAARRPRRRPHTALEEFIARRDRAAPARSLRLSRLGSGVRLQGRALAPVTFSCVDTSVWSMALRRDAGPVPSPFVEGLVGLLRAGEPVFTTGISPSGATIPRTQAARSHRRTLRRAAFPRARPNGHSRRPKSATDVAAAASVLLLAALCIRHELLTGEMRLRSDLRARTADRLGRVSGSHGTSSAASLSLDGPSQRLCGSPSAWVRSSRARRFGPPPRGGQTSTRSSSASSRRARSARRRTHRSTRR